MKKNNLMLGKRLMNIKEKIIAIIPARYESSRFPGKPLVDICGKPMIQWVYERVSSVQEIEDVYVATDDKRIFDTVKNFSGRAIMTGECACGTDRVYQACKDKNIDIVINVQGDEPLIRPEMIRDLIQSFKDETVEMATLKKKIETVEEKSNPNVVKVAVDKFDNAIYFSRYSIPYIREKISVDMYKHIGIYGYRKSFLEKYVSMPQGILEKAENLEQLRVLENGYKIRVNSTNYQTIGVDRPEDVARVIKQIEKEGINCGV